MQSLMTLHPNTVLSHGKNPRFMQLPAGSPCLSGAGKPGCSTPPEKLGAVGTQSNNFVVAEYPSKTGDLQVVVYNQLNGKFYGGCYTPPPDVESTPEKYEFKDSKQSGAALLFALMPVFLADEECNEKYQELKAHRDNGYPDLDAAAETAAVLCDNIYRRTRYASVSRPVVLRLTFRQTAYCR